MKISLKNKFFLWLFVILIISFLLYGALIYFVYAFNLSGPKYFEALKEHSGFDQSIIDRIKDLEIEDGGRFSPPRLTIIPPNLFVRVFFTITGGVLAIIIIATSSGFLFLRRMLNQVGFITKNAKEINDRKLHIRFNLKGKDPISNMAKTFDSMLDQIENSFKNQKQFIQNASHELNTPLTIMKTKIDVLKQKKPITTKDYKETVDLIDSEIMRLSQITEQLLILSDLEENGFKTEPAKINFKSILEKMIKLFDNQINSRNLTIDASLDAETDILGNKIQIEQLIFNLFDNAVKYSAENSRLIINLSNSKDKKRFIFKITNKTMLIDEKDIPNIFERFYKSSDIRGRKGFGLGLAIVKNIIEKNNGNIDISYNDVLKEITFIISFPLYQSYNSAK